MKKVKSKTKVKAKNPLKFNGRRPLKDVVKKFREDGWLYQHDKYDKGSDYVSFFRSSMAVILNTFNYKFLVTEKKPFCPEPVIIATEESKEFDDVHWYKDILHRLFV